MSPEALSIRPSEMVEGGAVPVDQNLTVKAARFHLYDYNGKAPAVVAAELVLMSDENQEYTQQYSVGDPKRIQPSEDGHMVYGVGDEVTAINKSSNFHLLMSNIVSAGFPENRFTGDVTVLVGLYAHWKGLELPKRAGLAQTAEQAARGPKIITVPDKILRLPGDNKKAPVKGAAAKAGAKKAGTEVIAAAVKLIKAALEDNDSVTRSELSAAIFSGDAVSAALRADVATFIYSDAMAGALAANGLSLDGETITAA